MDKKTCLTPESNPRLQTIRLNTSTDSQVTHIFRHTCGGVCQDLSELQVIKKLIRKILRFIRLL